MASMHSRLFCFVRRERGGWQRDVNTYPLLLTIPHMMKAFSLDCTRISHLIETEGLSVMRFSCAMHVSYESLQEWLKQREARMEYNEGVL
jgi:hypothetical protein